MRVLEAWVRHRAQAPFEGRFIAILSASEVGVGALLHSFHLPLTGYFLSLNQAFWLARMAREAPKDRSVFFLPAQISAVVALMKTLAPAGKKLTPMLAIGAQGILFSCGLLFVPRVVGAVFGSVLLSIWSFVQPVLIYWLVFGNSFWSAVNFGVREWNLGYLVIGLVVLKAALAAGLAILAFSVSQERADRIARSLQKTMPRVKTKPARSPLAGALRDLVHPLFLISLGLSTFFFWNVESSHARAIWGALRPVAVAFMLFYLVRAVPVWLKRA